MDVAGEGIVWRRVSGIQREGREGGKDVLEEEEEPGAEASDEVEEALANATAGIREGPARGRAAPTTATRRRNEFWIDMSEMFCRLIQRSSGRARKMDDFAM